jgi:bifunctional ADP-heptose synthase (sugar kinase/adenylyltransferase)/phosphoglycolate phosphatase-like HAD superfamily hydrolase
MPDSIYENTHHVQYRTWCVDINRLLPYRSPPSIAIVGDICLDLYYFIGEEGAEISAETGLQSNSVYETKIDAGGGANVAVNCKKLGAKWVDLYGLVGDDHWGGILKALLTQNGIGIDGVLVQEENWQTHVFHKIYEGKNELPRYDMGNRNRPSEQKADAVLDLLESKLDTYQCVIVNEQVPQGLHSPYFQEKLAALIAANKDKVIWFSDCRKLNDRYAHTIRKLNIREARQIIAANKVPLHEANSPHLAADWLNKCWGLPVVLTMGEEGALVCDESGCEEINSIHFIKEIDIVGAGDAFLAGLVTAQGAGLSLREAAIVGTFSAGVCLGKLFETGHPSVNEVIALAKDCEFNYHPRLAADETLAVYAKETSIEIVAPNFSKKKKAPLKTAIFDHDGTISVLRQGWEEVMYTVMVDAIIGKGSLSFAEIDAVQKAVRTLIEKTTGIQTLAQMYQLKEMVLSFGYVLDAEVLSPEEYKNIYNARLFASMEERLCLVKEGKLAIEDVTIKGALGFLRKLADAGTKLYLASGTDQGDVVREAELLGYADLFSGGICGSVGDINNDPKKIVIRNIIARIEANGGNPAEAAVFGDGPVEMREAKKAGLLAVGVLSDERRRWGRNMDKRKRLILGGADFLIPDFSCSNDLALICGWGG